MLNGRDCHVRAVAVPEGREEEAEASEQGRDPGDGPAPPACATTAFCGNGGAAVMILFDFVVGVDLLAIADAPDPVLRFRSSIAMATKIP